MDYYERDLKMNRIISIVLLLTTTFSMCCICNIRIYATDNNNVEISLEDDFAEDRVIVVMSNKVSLKFNNYCATDFSKYGCKSVRDLSTATANKVQEALENISDHILNNTPLINYQGVNLGEYSQILCLYLKYPGKENVIAIVL